MKRSNEFILRTIKDVPYILPIGQALCDYKKGINTNETGATIWHLLENEISEAEIVNALLKEYELDSSYESAITNDVSSFINLLKDKQMLMGNNNITTSTSSAICTDVMCPSYKTLHIAGISMNLCGPREAWSHDFDKFYGENTESPDLSIYIIPSKDSISVYSGKRIVQNREISIYEKEDMYILYFETSEYIKEIHLYKSGNQAYIHCLPQYNEQAIYDIFHAVRPCFLYHAASKGIVAVHSASILYKEKVWLFSAPSQTGKSTHTSLWHKLFNSQFINGDLNLIGMSNGTPVVYGGPWCGTSTISTVGQFKLGGIILLKQAPDDFVVELSNDRQCFLVLQRVVSIPVNVDIYDSNLEIISQVTDKCLVAQLCCTKNDNAAIVMKEYIDSKL